MRRKACCKALSPTTTATKSSFGIDIVVVPGVRRNLFSVMTAAKKGIATIFNYENPRLEGFNVIVPLRSESGDLYSFVLDVGADRHGAKELAMNAVANAQVWRRRLGHLSRTATFATWGKLNSLLTSRETTTRGIDLSS